MKWHRLPWATFVVRRSAVDEEERAKFKKFLNKARRRSNSTRPCERLITALADGQCGSCWRAS